MTNKFPISNFQFPKIARAIFVASAILFLAAGCNQKSTVNNQQPVVSNQIQQIQVDQTVQGSNFNKPDGYKIEQGRTALDLLKSSHQIETKEFAGIGEFVETIDGIKPDSKHYWAFYINGKSSEVGAGSYKLQNGDRIEWKLEEIK